MKTTSTSHRAHIAVAAVNARAQTTKSTNATPAHIAASAHQLASRNRLSPMRRKCEYPFKSLYTLRGARSKHSAEYEDIFNEVISQKNSHSGSKVHLDEGKRGKFVQTTSVTDASMYQLSQPALAPNTEIELSSSPKKIQKSCTPRAKQ